MHIAERRLTNLKFIDFVNQSADEAKIALSKGIDSAIRQGNQHARSEMEALLSELG